ncbi:methyltransferase domain-containing protein [Lachnospiraceae bacterium C1.1]|nr:class I SAM-dependent methyltransferase [Lachnospiraceae bacterium C1.1]
MKTEKIILFGASKVTKKILNYEPRENVDVLFICDNNSSLWGETISGIEIVSPERIKSVIFDRIILCFINGTFLCDVYDQVLDMGIDKEKIILSHSADTLGYVKSPLEEFFIIPSKTGTSFVRQPAIIKEVYEGETKRCNERRSREGFFEKYCNGEGLDIGYGSDPIMPSVYGWDIENGDAQYLNGVSDESLDYVYSSHCLEHLWDVRLAIKNWFRVIKRGGHLIIAVPHRDLYEKKKTLPSRWNGDHKHMFLIGRAESPDTLDIVEEVREGLMNFDYDIEYVKTCKEGYEDLGERIHSKGEYQIEMVIRKK